MRFLVALGCALVVGGEVTAVDYDKVERRLTKEPVYQTKKPRYALLLFGTDAKLAVWVVLDGETVFVDRNGDGDLTGEGEKFAKEAECKAIEIKDPDGKTRYTIDRIQTDHSFYSAQMRRKREGKGLPPGLMAYVSVKGTAEYQQYCDIVEMRDSPKEAMLAHFHGPLTIAPMTINWKVPASTALQKGKNPPEFIANIGTMSEKHGCWVVVRTCDEKECAFPAGVRPIAEVEFSAATPEGAPIKKTYTLSGYRCGAAFRENLQVPDGVGAGKAKVRLSFDAWKDGRVAPSTFEIPVREPEADAKDK